MAKSRSKSLGNDEALLLMEVARRVISARVREPEAIDDLVQETLARVLAAHARLDGEALVPYAIVTARHLVATLAREASAGAGMCTGCWTCASRSNPSKSS